MSKGKLDNMCFDAGIWSLKVKKTGKTSEVCLCLAPVQHINILLMCLSKFFTELNLLVFLKYHQTFQISFRLKEVLKLDFHYQWMLRSIFSYIIIKQQKGEVLAGPFGLEHQVLILLSWQPLDLCMEEKCLLLPWSILSNGLHSWLYPMARQSLREASTVHPELKFPLISLRCSYRAFFLPQGNNMSD